MKEETGEESKKVSITIPQTGVLSGFNTWRKQTDSKFKDINFMLISVIIILLVMVATLVIDSFHINSAVYKEYSEKNDSIDILQKTNIQLLEQNRSNQDVIIELQKEIIKSNLATSTRKPVIKR